MKIDQLIGEHSEVRMDDELDGQTQGGVSVAVVSEDGQIVQQWDTTDSEEFREFRRYLKENIGIK